MLLSSVALGLLSTLPLFTLTLPSVFVMQNRIAEQQFIISYLDGRVYYYGSFSESESESLII